VYSLNLDHKDDLRPIANGLHYCERLGRLWLLSRRSIFQGRLKDGLTIRRLSFMDDDRYDTKKLEAELVKQMKQEKEQLGQSLMARSQAVQPPQQQQLGNQGSHVRSGNQSDNPGNDRGLLAVNDTFAPDHDFHAHHDRLLHSEEDLQHQMNLPKHMHHIHSAEGNLMQVLGNLHFEQDHQREEIENQKSMTSAHKLVKDDYITAVASGERMFFVGVFGCWLTVFCCCATDVLGKKIFIGTLDGHVMLFDSVSFGLLQHLGKPEMSLLHKSAQAHFGNNNLSNDSSAQIGFVASLVFVERDELLIACYAWGAIKIFTGCHRNSHTLNETPILYRPPAHSRFPGGCGGNPPCHKLLFREADFGFEASQESAVIAAVFSDVYNVIIVAVRNGHVRIFDYITLQLQNVLQSPMLAGQVVENTSLAVLNNLPVILVGDTIGHIHLFSFAPLPVQWVVSFCPWTMYSDKGLDPSSVTANAGDAHSSTGGAVRVMTVVYYECNQGLATGLCGNIQPDLKPTQIRIDGLPAPEAAQGNSGKVSFAVKTKGAIPPSLPKHPFRFKTFKEDVIVEPLLVSSKSASTANFDAVMSPSKTADGLSLVSVSSLSTPNTPKTSGRARRSRLMSQSVRGAGNVEGEHSGAANKFLRTWVLLMGDDVGRMYQMDLTKLLIKAGCCELLTPVKPAAGPAEEIIDGTLSTTNLITNISSGVVGALVYSETKNTKLFHGLTRAQSVALELQLKRPVGSHVTEFTRSVNGVNSKDVVLLKKWSAFGGIAIRAICPIVDTRRRYGVGSQHSVQSTTAASSPPKCIILASDVGIIKSWSWDGDLMGEMADEPTEEVPDVPKNLVKNVKRPQPQCTKKGCRQLVPAAVESTAGSASGMWNKTDSPAGNSSSINGNNPTSDDQSIRVIVNAAQHEHSSAEAAKAAQNGVTADQHSTCSKDTKSADKLIRDLLKAIEAETDLESESVLQPVQPGFGWKLVHGDHAADSDGKNANTAANEFAICQSPHSTGSALGTAAETAVVMTKAVSAFKIESDYVGALTAWIIPQIRITEVEMSMTIPATKFSTALDACEVSTYLTTSESNVSPFSSQRDLLGNFANPSVLTPRGVGDSAKAPASVNSNHLQPPPLESKIRTEFREVGSAFDEKYFSDQFYDIHFTDKAREFADSMTHAPLDYADGDSIDPHEFQSSVLHIEKMDSFQAFLQETESVRKRGEAHIEMANDFKDIWSSKTRFKCLEYELDNGTFNTFPDPDFALGKTKYGSILKKRMGRSTGIDFLVEREMQAYERSSPSGFKELTQEVKQMQLSEHRTKVRQAAQSTKVQAGNTRLRQDKSVPVCAVAQEVIDAVYYSGKSEDHVNIDFLDDLRPADVDLHLLLPRSKLVVETGEADMPAPLVRQGSAASALMSTPKAVTPLMTPLLTPKRMTRSNSLLSGTGITSLKNYNERIDRSSKMDKILGAFFEGSTKDAMNITVPVNIPLVKNVQFSVPDSPNRLSQRHRQQQQIPSRQYGQRPQTAPIAGSSKSLLSSGNNSNFSGDASSGATGAYRIRRPDELAPVRNEEERQKQQLKEEFYGKLKATAVKYDTIIATTGIDDASPSKPLSHSHSHKQKESRGSSQCLKCVPCVMAVCSVAEPSKKSVVTGAGAGPAALTAGDGIVDINKSTCASAYVVYCGISVCHEYYG
jgi:hypothetical protein